MTGAHAHGQSSGGGHGHGFYRPGDTPIHRLPSHCKLAAAVVFVVAVAATPRERLWAFAAYALLLAGVAATARVRPGFIARRMLVETPFVAFAVLLPFLARGERAEVMGIAVSVGGVWSAWNILAKASLGVVVSILLAATTQPRDLFLGLERLRLPALLTQMATFMFRYLDVIVGELRRMRIARASRGFEARNIRHLPILARSLGVLFLRSYERGERVYLAMASRGYTGQLPTLAETPTSAAQWVVAAILPAAAIGVSVGAYLVT